MADVNNTTRAGKDLRRSYKETAQELVVEKASSSKAVPRVLTGRQGVSRGFRRPARPGSAARRLGIMRWVDHWVGLPLCFFFGLSASLMRAVLPKRKRRISGKGTLAVLKFFGMGTIVAASPLLRAIRKKYPEARLVFVTFESNRILVEKLNLGVDLRVIRTSSPLKFVFDVLRVIFYLRVWNVEAVVDLEFFSRFSTLLSFASWAGIRVGYHLNDFWRNSLVTHPIYFNYFRNLTDIFCEAGRQLDVKVEDIRPARIDPGEQAEASVKQWLQAKGWTTDRRLLGVNVNASELSYERSWDIKRFAAVIQEVLQRHEDLDVVLTGSGGERIYAESLLKFLPSSLRDRVFVAAGEWSLEEFLAGLLLLDGFLTNDSGPMHMAAAQGTAMVSIWGPTRPGFFAPQSDTHRIVWDDYPCSPCVGMFTAFEGMWCDHEGWCMQEIAPQTVIDEVEHILENSKDG